MADTPIAQFVVVPAECAGERADSFLRRILPQLSRAARAELIAAGGVRIAGRTLRKGDDVRSGDRVEIRALAPGIAATPDDSLPLRVVYEDDALVAVDKPAGVPSHALRVDERGTIASALLARYPEMAGIGYSSLEAGLLHRLDTDTSGILVAARNATAFTRLRELHRQGGFEKQYFALVWGHAAADLEARFGRAFLRADRRNVRVELEPFEGAKPIAARLLSIEARGELSLVCVQVTLARRHQVRAQLARVGHPIAGDARYGGAALPGLSRHFLHASRVVLPHPDDGRRLVLTSALAPELRAVLDTLPLTAAELSR